jgi:hypothetical protein
MGWMGSFPEAVWHDPKAAANILSLYTVKKYYRVRYDSFVDDAFIVSNKDGTEYRFIPTGNGLYAYHRQYDDDWAFVSTVAEKRETYTKRGYQSALRARQVQNILMYPCTRDFQDIISENLLPNCPIRRDDIIAADDIFGCNIGALKGKTVHTPGAHVDSRIDGIPYEIKQRYGDVTLSIDIMFINKMPFFITKSRNFHFGTVEYITNRQTPTVKSALQRVLGTYKRRGLKVTTIEADPEFEALAAIIRDVQFNFSAQNEHVPDIERYIRTVKDRVRSCYNTLPYSRIPRLMLSRLVGNAVFWLNAFPHSDGVSSTMSPRYLLTGKHIDYHKHVRLEFGAYAQTHEQHTNDMEARTTGAICLGPSGNDQGGHYFMSLTTGRRLHRHRWTALPLPDDARNRVSHLGRQQNMPSSLTFADRFGTLIPDTLIDVEERSHASSTDSSYRPYDDLDDANSFISLTDDDSSTSESTGSECYHPSNTPETTGVSPVVQHQNTSEDNDNSDNHINYDDDLGDDPHDSTDECDDDNDNDDLEDTDDADAKTDADTNDTDDADTETDGIITGVGVGVTDTNVDQALGTTGVDSDDMMDAKYGPRNHDINLRPRKPRNYDHRYDFQQHLLDKEEPFGVLFMTEQMSLRRGLQHFGQKGAEAVVSELRQVHYRQVIQPRYREQLSPSQRRQALRYLMYLKQKRCGRIKARGCADGRKQRLYKSKEETSSPTVSTDAVFLTSIVDAMERRCVATLDIPGAFMHADMDEIVHMRLDGPMAELLVRVDPEKYKPYLTMEGKNQVLYVELNKALYGTLQAALLFWKNLTGFLIKELGFVLNKYDRCVANKMIKGKQCTIIWHVDDLKISHVDPDVIEEIIKKISDKYGKEDPVTVNRGKIHDYLGMTIDFSCEGKVKFTMHDYIENVLYDAPASMNGTAATPAANHLFEINATSSKLCPEDAETFHHITAQLLYLSKRARPDIQTAVSFLCTRVVQPDTDDWKKLGRCIRYLRGTKDLGLTLEAETHGVIKWWIDASYAVHHDMKSHTGITMTLGKGCPMSSSTRQKINTKSSTEAELVGVDDGMGVITWTRNFLREQQFNVTDNIVYQDNQSAILLERNGRGSSGRRTRHIDIRYFFICDRIKNKELRVEYCPTKEMLADFFTKPLQGSLFKRLRGIIMNIADDVPLPITTNGPQECVGDHSWADVVTKGLVRVSTGNDVVNNKSSSSNKSADGDQDNSRKVNGNH